MTSSAVPGLVKSTTLLIDFKSRIGQRIKPALGTILRIFSKSHGAPEVVRLSGSNQPPYRYEANRRLSSAAVGCGENRVVPFGLKIAFGLQ